MEIRRYCGALPTSVAAGIAPIFLSAFSAPPRNESWTIRSVLNYIDAQNYPSLISLVVMHEGRIVGFCCGQNMCESSKYCDFQKFVDMSGKLPSFYISDIAVLRIHRGKGVGKSLLNAMLDEIQDYKSCIARTRIDAIAIRKLFFALGFFEIGKHYAEIQGSTAQRSFFVKEII